MNCILELKTSQTTTIKILMDTINALILDANFEFYPKTDDHPGGLVIKEVTKTGKILIHLKIDADKFEYYNYNYEKQKLILGIDMTSLCKYLKCISNFDTMKWILDEDDINKLIIILESNDKKERKKIKMNLMDLEQENYDIAPIQFSYSITLPSHDFHKYCKDMLISSDKIEIKITSNKLYLSGKGDSGDIEFEIEQTTNGLNITSATDNKNDIIQGLFELKFLLIFAKCTSLANYITLYMKNDYPIIVIYKINNLGEIKLVLSPTRIL